ALLGLAAIGGLLLALGRTLFRFTPLLLAVLTGLSIALDSAPDAISLRDAALTQFGTFCGAVILFVAIVEFTRAFKGSWQHIALRIAGSWIAASAILVLALRLAKS